MNKLIWIIIPLVVSCGAESKIVGKWTSTQVGTNTETVETCNFHKNGSETCEVKIDIKMGGDIIKIEYVATYEWSIDDDSLVFKSITSLVRSISVDDVDLSRADEKFLNIQGLIAASLIEGRTSQRKYRFDKNNLLLQNEDGSWQRWSSV